MAAISRLSNYKYKLHRVQKVCLTIVSGISFCIKDILENTDTLIKQQKDYTFPFSGHHCLCFDAFLSALFFCAYFLSQKWDHVLLIW